MSLTPSTLSTPSTFSAAALPLTVLLACAPLNPAAAEPAPALQSTPRHNEVFLRFGPSVHKIDFEYTQSLISEAEPLGGVTVQRLADGLRILVVAPRKGTEEVARDLLQRVGGEAWHMIGAGLGPYTDAVAPERLNFWVHGRLWIDGVELPGGLYLAQGHQTFSNNWWVAQPNAVFAGSCSELRIPGGNGKLYCLRTRPQDGVYTFQIGDCMAPPSDS